MVWWRISDPPRLPDWLEFLLRWGGIALIVAGVVVFLTGVLRLGRAQGAKAETQAELTLALIGAAP